MSRYLRKQKGVSIVATVLTMLFLAVFGAVVVSLVTTGASISQQEEQGMQAFYIAEGGIEFSQRDLAQNLNWYRSAVDPIQIPATSLGSGTFSVDTMLPATLLKTRVPDAAGTNPIRVYSTGRFPTTCPPCYLQLDDDIPGGSGEFISYTGIGTTAAACSGPPPCFTGITRDVAIGGVGGTAASHERGDTVYPVTTLTDALAATCVAPATFRITYNSKFLGSGTLDIEGEEIIYSGSSISGGVMTLIGIKRCQDFTTGPPGNTPAAHAAGVPVTPVLVIGDSSSYQAESVSTGTAGSAVRAVTKVIQR